MQKTLLRQLRRSVGMADEAALTELLDHARAAAGTMPPAVAALLAGFGDLLARVDGAYSQYERDLELRTRSLELSSAELSATNDRLRSELASRERALLSLRSLVGGLLPDDLATAMVGDVDLEGLLRLVSQLVKEREAGRRALDNQKFALDQHAIVSITDTAGIIRYANDKFCEISGYRREELLGQNHRLVRSAVHPPEFFCELWETITGGQVWHGEICNLAKDGRLYWVNATIVPLLDADGIPEEYIAIRTDITDSKATEVALQQAKDSAEAASRAKGEFLANMSHEIRTPMNGIIGMTDLALDTPLDDEQREYLSIVKTSSEALLTLLNDILDFSKIEAGKLLVESIPFDLHRVIAETLKTFAVRAREKSLELVCDIDGAVPARVLGDPGRLRQVLMNLVGNAIKFTDRGEIVLRAEVRGRSGEGIDLHVAVRDTGIGIAPAKQAAIFESFTQEDSSTTRRYGGSGLGLTISSRLVQLMGGRMWVDSQVGQGSTFHFTTALLLNPAPAEAAAERGDLRGRRILVVDDNATNREVLCALLGRWGMRATAAPSGAAALALLDQGEAAYDAILVDARMPDMDGFQLADAIHARPPGGSAPPIVLLSSGAMRGEARECLDHGIAAYFAKPVAAEELLTALGQFFAGAAAPGPAAPLLTRHSLRENSRALEVLVVEDHPVNQKLVANLLHKWGHRATLANHGGEALDRLAQGPFDLILMDMQMPVMGGIEATSCIRAREAATGQAPTPIIAMTANVMPGDREACLAAGMDDYIAKPIKASELRERLAAFGGTAAPGLGGSAFDYRQGIRDADRETIEIIAGVFLATYPRDLERLRAAAGGGDADLLERTAHSLKATLASFGAQPAVCLAAEIEARARNGRLDGCGGEVERLAGEVERLIPHVEPFARGG